MQIKITFCIFDDSLITISDCAALGPKDCGRLDLTDNSAFTQPPYTTVQNLVGCNNVIKAVYSFPLSHGIMYVDHVGDHQKGIKPDVVKRGANPLSNDT